MLCYFTLNKSNRHYHLGTAALCCFTLDKLYIIGDKKKHQLGYSNVDVVNLSTGMTFEAASMQTPRISPAVTSSESSLFVFGGCQDEECLSSCEMFNIHLEMRVKPVEIIILHY